MRYGDRGVGRSPGVRAWFPVDRSNMRLSLRFVIPLLLALAAFAYVAVPLVDKLTVRWFVRDLDTVSWIVSPRPS